MLDIGMSELLVIGIVALVVIGPKDLPDMFRTMGRFTAKARGMAREFSRAMENAADEAGVKDVAKDLRAVTSPKSFGLDAVKDAATKFEAWDPMKARPTLPKGPATQALADAQAAKKAAVTPVAEAAAAEPSILAPAVAAEPQVPATAARVEPAVPAPTMVATTVVLPETTAPMPAKPARSAAKPPKAGKAATAEPVAKPAKVPKTAQAEAAAPKRATRKPAAKAAPKDDA